MKLWRIILSFLFGWGAFVLGMLSYKWMARDLFILTTFTGLLFILVSMSLAQDDGIYRGRNSGDIDGN